MKSFTPKPKIGLKVGEIVDAMASVEEFKNLGRETIFSVVEIFLKEYIGMPGTIVTKKFTPEEATSLADRVGIPRDMVVKIITVFRLRAGKTSDQKSKMMKSYQKVRVAKGGIRSSPMSKL